MPEFFKACFGVLCKESDPDKKPCMVIETEELSPEMEELYAEHGILWVYIRREQNQFVLDCEHEGTCVRGKESKGNLTKLLDLPLLWYEQGIASPQGSLVHGSHEQVLREAVLNLKSTLGVECHHQVPLGYVLGHKPDLTLEEKRILTAAMDAVVVQSLNTDPNSTVILPISLNIHPTHRTDPKTMKRDSEGLALCEKYRVPLLVIESDGNDIYHFECSQLNLSNSLAAGLVPESWSKALVPFVIAAMQYAK